MKKVTCKIELEIELEYDNRVWSEKDAADAVRYTADVNLNIHSPYVRVLNSKLK